MGYLNEEIDFGTKGAHRLYPIRLSRHEVSLGGLYVQSIVKHVSVNALSIIQ